MNLTRLRKSLDTDHIRPSHVAVVGVGGSSHLITNLARCGVGRFTLVDPDTVEPANLARQGFQNGHVGGRKVSAVAAALRAIAPDVAVRELPLDFTAMDDAAAAQALAGVNLLILATDSFAAQARGNQVALALGIPAVWIGLFAGGLGGEVAFWHDGVTSCFRCLMSHRYAAQEKARAGGERLDPPSDGVTIFDTDFVDAVAGQVVLGLLTRGADNRFGRLVDRLGQRNYLLVKIDPEHRTAGRDLVREQLGVGEACPAFFGWTTVALSDPTAGREVCPDCRTYRATPAAGGAEAGPAPPPSRTATRTASRTNPPPKASGE